MRFVSGKISNFAGVKRLVPYLLSILLLYNATGYYLVYELKKSILKESVRRILKAGSIRPVVLDIPDPTGNPAFRWVEEDEFSYYGKLFDVVKRERRGGSIRFYCIRDIKEETLVEGFRKTMNSESVRKIFTQVIKIALPPTVKAAEIPYYSRISFPSTEISVPSGFGDSSFHPPEIA